jgi:PAS domain S-box-containing protein
MGTELKSMDYEQIIQVVTNGMRIIDRDFNVVQLNKAYSDFFGVDENESIGRKCYEVLNSSLCHTSACPLEVILNGEQFAQYEMQIENIEGNNISYTSNVRPLYSSDDKLFGIVEEIRDNTEAKKIIDEIRIRDSILASSINAIAVADLDGMLTYVNSSFLEMWGHDVKEAMSKPITDFWQMGNNPADALSFLYKRGKWVSEGVISKKDGSTSYIQILASIVVDETDTPICIVTSFIDITELKRTKESKIRAQAALAVAKSNTDTIKSIMDAVVIAVAITDLNGMIIRFNKGFSGTFGFDSPDLSKQITEFFTERDMPKILDGINKCLENGHASSIECNAISSDKGEIIVIIDFTLMTDSRGNTTGIIVVIRDVTEQRKSEETKERLSKEIIEKNKELEQMIRIVSHDLRSPLVNIQGFSNELDISCKQVREIIGEFEMSDDLTERLTPILNEDIPEILGYILVSVSKIDMLLSGLLRISRLGRASINIEGLDMNELLSNVIGTFEFQLKNLGINLIVDDLPSCIGDEAQINQVFSNLINNAIKYLDPNKKGFMQVSGYKKNGRVIYSVEDNGIGISPEHQEKIFDLFYRLDPKSTSGEGLGLNIIRKILDRHDGKVWVESEYGKGSKFYISLPNRQKIDSPMEC